MEQFHRLTIEYAEIGNQRVDKYLLSLEIEEIHSRSFLHKLIEKGLLNVNNKRVKKNFQLTKGDSILLDIPSEEPTDIIPQDIELAIVYEDEYLAVIDKPAGLTVHPAPGNPSNTLANALVYRYKGTLSDGSGNKRPGIVHRLDKNTSGLIVIARDNKTHALLSQAFSERQVSKTYIALLQGRIDKNPEESWRCIEEPIGRNRNDRKKMAVRSEGKSAVTYFRAIEPLEYFTKTEIRIETGRTHQIRVHLTWAGHPVLGDRTYSTLKQELAPLPTQLQKRYKHICSHHLTRQALHAHKLAFRHPITGKELNFVSPFPPDMEKTWQQLLAVQEMAETL